MRSFRVSTLVSLAICMILVSFEASRAAQFIKDYKNVTIVFIPGIYGSILKDEAGNVFWGENGIGDKGLSLEQFPELKPSLFQDVKFSIGVLGKTIKGYSGVRQNLQQLGPKVLVFPYDWRQSNKKSAAKLADFLCVQFPEIRKNQRLVFVAHSMGGLVLRHWIKDHLGQPRSGCQPIGIENVNSFTFAGTPHAGSMEPVRTLFNGKTSLDENPIYSWLFTERMSSDAITFESVYELLPAANIGGTECFGQDETAMMRVSKDINTGDDLPVLFNDIETWRTLGIPASLPTGADREAALSLIHKRIIAASKIVCELHNTTPPPAVSAKMEFIVGELKDLQSGEFSESTVESVKLIVRPSKSPEIRETLGKGDGTVPYWSSEPRGLQLFGLGLLPYPSNSAHAEILDDVSIVAHLQRLLEDAAYQVALLGDKPLDSDLETKDQLLKTIEETKSLPLERISPEAYAALVQHLAGAAASLEVSGLEIYRLASNYKGSNADRYKAIGFAVASIAGTGLNDLSRAWANQNATVALLTIGNRPLSAALALRTGEANYMFASKPDVSLQANPSQLESIEQRWRRVFGSAVPPVVGQDARELFATVPSFDPSVFDSRALGSYSTLPEDFLRGDV